MHLLNEYDAVFSPVYRIPDKFKESQLLRYTILYDAIPILFPELSPFAQAGTWYNDLIQTLSDKDYYFAISNQTRSDFIKLFQQIDPNKVEVIPLGTSNIFYHCNDKNIISEVKSKYKIPENTKYVFSLCSLEPRKNLIFAAETFIKFINQYEINDLYLVLGGGHWSEFLEVLKERISNIGQYQDKIIIIGYVDDADLAPLYSDAFCFIYPSLYEGFGLPILEAMKCGCPIISSNISSIPEVVSDAGILINPHNESELIDALYKYYYDNSFRHTKSLEGSIRSEKFHWKETTNVIIERIARDL